jgi:hypothetical protein
MTSGSETSGTWSLATWLRAFLVQPRPGRAGFIAMIAMSLAYTLVSVFLAIIGGTPNPPPYLRIPSEQYFFWASFFYAPVLILGWVLASAVMQIVGRALGGSGSFEGTLAVLGVATAVATLPALIPDLALTFLQVVGAMEYEPWFYSVTHGGAWFWIVWVYLGLYLIAFCILYPAAAKAVHSLERGKAILAGLVSFAAYQGFIFVFLR